jgi:hypothetical protein
MAILTSAILFDYFWASFLPLFSGGCWKLKNWLKIVHFCLKDVQGGRNAKVKGG